MRVVAFFLVLLFLVPPARAEVGTVAIGHYVSRVAEGAAADFLEIERDGKIVYREDNYLRMRLNGPLEDSGIRVDDGQDISGDDVPDLVVFGWSGGAHCCFRTWVFSLGDTLGLIAVVDGVHEEAHLRQLDADSALEFEVRDWTFEYWPNSFGSTPSVKVILDWQSNVLEPSLELTELVQHGHENLQAEAAELHSSSGWLAEVPPLGAVFQRALGLVYLGQPELAVRFICASWGGDSESMVRYTLEFGRRLERSPYLAKIEGERR